MRRFITVTTAALLGAVLVVDCRAHDLKVMLRQYLVEPGANDTVFISYGHVLPVGGPIDAATLDEYYLRTPSGSVLYLKKEGSSLQSNDVHIEEQGVYQAVAARQPSVWCEVVDANGNHSHHRGTRSKISRELGTVELATHSQTYAKALLISGKTADNPVEPLGHEIEIVPVAPPREWRCGRDLQFKVLFQGKALSSAELLATYVGFKPDNAWCYATYSNAKGIAVLRPSQPGVWVLRVMRKRPAAKDKQADYDVESHTATLVLEVQP
jgi:uncharacterized GH25 family protein